MSLRLMVLCFVSLVWCFPGMAEVDFDDIPMEGAVSFEEEEPVEGEAVELVEVAEGQFFAVQVREALELAVAFLRETANLNDEGWYIPPTRTRTRVDTKMVERRFSKETVEVQEWEYKTVEQYRNVKRGDSVDAVMVREKVNVRIPVALKGTRKVEREIPDPNGSIVRMVSEGVYDEGGPDLWRGYLFGHNALIMYALLESGVDPRDELIERVSSQMQVLFGAYGLPDNTWDLGWITAAYSMMPGTFNQDLARRAAERLMEGQLQSGPAAGMWGTVCVNHATLAQLLIRRKAAGGDFLKVAATTEEDPRRAARQEARKDEIRDSLSMLDEVIRKVTMLGALDRFSVAHNLMDDAVQAIRMVGHPHHLFNQTSVDIGSTATALYGLRIAARQKVLPRVTTPILDPQKKPFSTPIKIEDVLRRALASVAKLQQTDGTWSESNMHYPIADFQKVGGIPATKADPKTFMPLPSATSLTSVAEGFSCLVSGFQIGGGGAVGAYGRNIHFGTQAVKTLLDAWEESQYKMNLGGAMGPYQALMYLRDLPPLPPEIDPQVWPRIARFLLSDQDPNGSWVAFRRARYLPSSFEERLRLLPGPSREGKPWFIFNKEQAFVPLELGEKDGERIWPRLEVMYNLRPHNLRSREERANGAMYDRALSTGMAMIFLTSGVREGE